jgi:hypothetical protein
VGRSRGGVVSRGSSTATYRSGARPSWSRSACSALFPRSSTCSPAERLRPRLA